MQNTKSNFRSELESWGVLLLRYESTEFFVLSLLGRNMYTHAVLYALPAKSERSFSGDKREAYIISLCGSSNAHRFDLSLLEDSRVSLVTYQQLKLDPGKYLSSNQSPTISLPGIMAASSFSLRKEWLPNLSALGGGSRNAISTYSRGITMINRFIWELLATLYPQGNLIDWKHTLLNMEVICNPRDLEEKIGPESLFYWRKAVTLDPSEGSSQALESRKESLEELAENSKFWSQLNPQIIL